MKKESIIQILLSEIDNLNKQVCHYDELFWKENQFFIVVQSAFLLGIIQFLNDQFSSEEILPLPIYLVFLSVFLFNLYLCYVWFRANRRALEYITRRVNRLKQIETEKIIEGVLYTYRGDDDKDFKLKSHPTSRWLMHIATGFIIFWIIMALFVSYKFFLCGLTNGSS
jgi:hypothetical protein